MALEVIDRPRPREQSSEALKESLALLSPNRLKQNLRVQICRHFSNMFVANPEAVTVDTDGKPALPVKLSTKYGTHAGDLSAVADGGFRFSFKASNDTKVKTVAIDICPDTATMSESWARKTDPNPVNQLPLQPDQTTGLSLRDTYGLRKMLDNGQLTIIEPVTELQPDPILEPPIVD